jgi:aspartate/methionine/tyrosine aminotransferase
MDYKRMPIESEAPEELGQTIHYDLSEPGTTELCLKDLGISIPTDLLLTYIPHRGSSRLRSLIAKSWKLDADDVLITAAATAALFIIATTLLSKDDHVVATIPNYPNNTETAMAIGAEVSYVDLDYDAEWKLDISQIAAAIRPNTKLISLIAPHNPTGVSMTESELRAMVDVAKDRGCYVLVDETYAELMTDSRLPSAASLDHHVIGVSTMSKAYGVPGIRVGWIMSKNKELREKFLAAKEMMCITIGAVDEYIAEKILERRDEFLERARSEMDHRRRIVDAWIESEELVEWVRPDEMLIGLVKVREEPPGGMKAFYDRLLNEQGANVGPGYWFGLTGPFFRLGFGWPNIPDLEAGLAAISKALRR